MPRTELMRLQARRPSLWERIRSFTIGPMNLKDPALARLFGGGRTLSGVSINESTAMSYSAVWSAVTMISDDIASLPLMLYKRLPTGGKDRFESHPLYRLLHDSPNPEMDAMVCFRTMQAHALLWQNAYAEIERDTAGRAVAIWPLVPERVSVLRDRGRLRYRVANDSGSQVFIDPEDMIHIVGHSHDGTEGSSLVQQARESLGLGLAAEKFGSTFFGNGATFGGVLSFPGAKPDEKIDKATRETLEARYSGIERAYRIMAVYNGAKYERVGVNPNEGQFNETRTFQIREVARWFKMPPHKLGDLADATYSNVEQMDAAYLSSCIRPWLVLWKQQLSRKLIARSERTIQFIEHDTHGFLSVDAASRAALYQTEIRVGGVTPNEIRGYENRDPIVGGDMAFVSADVIPLSKVEAYWDALIESKKPPKQEALPPAQNDDDAKALRQAISAMESALEAMRVEKGQAEQRAEDLSAARDEADKGRDEAKAELAHTLELYAGATTALAAEQAERAREVGEVKALAVDWERKAGEFADAVSARCAELNAKDADVSRLTAELVETKDNATHLAADVAREQENLRLAKADYEERFEQLREGTKTAQAERDAAVTGRQTAEGVCAAAVQRADAAERDKGIAESAQAAANAALDELSKREAKRLMDVIAAHRALVVEAMRRQVVKETDRARRHQGTPQKLRAWMETFYEGHIDSCVEALTPILRAHLAWMQSDADPAEKARQIASQHVEDSLKQLRDVLAVDEFHPTLERTLSRWEERRPDAIADEIVREGVAYVRSHQ